MPRGKYSQYQRCRFCQCRRRRLCRKDLNHHHRNSRSDLGYHIEERALESRTGKDTSAIRPCTEEWHCKAGSRLEVNQRWAIFDSSHTNAYRYGRFRCRLNPGQLFRGVPVCRLSLSARLSAMVSKRHSRTPLSVAVSVYKKARCIVCSPIERGFIKSALLAAILLAAPSYARQANKLISDCAPCRGPTGSRNFPKCQTLPAKTSFICLSNCARFIRASAYTRKCAI